MTNTPDKIRQALAHRRTSSLYDAQYNAESESWLRWALDDIERLQIALHTHESYDKTVGELYEENQQLQAQLDAKDTEIAELKAMHDVRTEDFKNLNRALEGVRKRNEERRQEIKDKDAQIAERDATIAKIQRDFEQTDWGARNIELTEQLNYWRELAGTRDNKIQELQDRLQSLKEPNT